MSEFIAALLYHLLVLAYLRACSGEQVSHDGAVDADAHGLALDIGRYAVASACKPYYHPRMHESEYRYRVENLVIGQWRLIFERCAGYGMRRSRANSTR